MQSPATPKGSADPQGQEVLENSGSSCLGVCHGSHVAAKRQLCIQLVFSYLYGSGDLNLHLQACTECLYPLSHHAGPSFNKMILCL